MPKVRTLAPLTDPKGNLLAAGAEVDVDDATAAAWRADGKVSLVEDEKKAQSPGVYDARTSRSDVSPQPEEEPKKKAK